MQRAIRRRSERSIWYCSASKRTTPMPPAQGLATSSGRRRLCSQSRMGLMPPSDSAEKWERSTLLAEEAIRRRSGSNPAWLRGEELQAGLRQWDCEALNGMMVLLGQEHSMSLPFNFAIYAALRPYANGAPR